MTEPQIDSIEGVWTKEQVTSLKNWLHSESGVSNLEAIQEKNREESKIIERLAIVDINGLKVPFTYII